MKIMIMMIKTAIKTLWCFSKTIKQITCSCIKTVNSDFSKHVANITILVTLITDVSSELKNTIRHASAYTDTIVSLILNWLMLSYEE